MSTLLVGFDLDMTLVDSRAGILATVRATLDEIGVAVPDDVLWSSIGVPMEDTMAAVVPSGDPVALTRRYRELFASTALPRTTLLPGAVAALDAVRAAGGRAIIVSTKVEPAVRLVVEHTGLQVDAVHGGLFAEGKGELLRSVRADVFVGDHPGDVVAATVAGAVSVGVATGPHPASDLVAAGADVVLDDLTAFPAWLGAWLDGRPAERRGESSR